MGEQFSYDVFLSHNSKDKAIVRELAERLGKDGLKVWFDEWVLRPGDHIPVTTEEGLEKSRALVLCMPTSANLREWADLEAHTSRFRDPQNRKRRLIPLRLDHSDIPASLRVFKYVDWSQKSDREYSLLVEACREVAGMPQLLQPKPPDLLVRQCQEGNCVLYAGAGLSAPAAFPTWKNLVASLVEWEEEQGGTRTRAIRSLLDGTDGGKYDLIADSVVGESEKRNGLPKLHAFLKTTFDKAVPITNRHRAIRELNLSAILTTNFDALLERTFSGMTNHIFTPSDTEQLLELLSRREFFIAKLYGSLDRPETLLLSPAQYKDAISYNRRFAEFIEGIFVSRTLLFLGSSLEGISAYLEGIRFRGGEQRHFALVAVSDPAWESKADILKHRYGIEVLPYNESMEHPEVDVFLRNLVSRISAKHGPMPRLDNSDRKGARGNSKLRRLLLKNIGPFSESEVDLTPDWNIILGDNGVGKTTILRSLALAICGRDAQVYAKRMLRSGESKAQITLETFSGRKYVTEIYRTSSGFDVESLPRRPLESEGWLALGFPPVRSATWRKSSGPQGERLGGRPNIDDLLPLLTSEPDPRLDDVKQWVINLDYWKSKGDSTGRRPRSYYERIQQRLFEVIKKLTGGLRIDFEGIDSDSWEVLVKTEDGIVPIDALSQGTASVIGWTGVLLRRLFDVYEDNDEPSTGNAIVVLDEIDAHMHPLWQQTLLSNLTDLFPNVQFIVTTHSPLIVGGMHKEQVIRLARDEQGRVEKVDIPADMLMGRADQILTGDLFGLPTTIDNHTLRLVEDYHSLLGKESLEPAQEQRLNDLRDKLRFRIPVSQEIPVERRAHEVIRLLLKQEIGDVYPDMQCDLLEKARQLLAAAKTKGRKP
jgi:predicted ATP-binding protein involved in virulence